MRSDVETPPEVWGSGRGSGSTSGSAYYQICNKCGAQLNAEGKCPKGCNSGSGSSGNTSGSGVRKCPVCQSQLINTTYCLQCGWKAYGSGSGSGNGNDSSGGGDGNGNNNNNNNNEKEPEKRTDCPPSAARNSTAVCSVIDNPTITSAPNHNVFSDISQLRRLAATAPNEYSVNIRFNSDSNQYFTSDIKSGTPTSVGIEYSPFNKTIIHTHGYGQVSVPSPKDVTTMVGMARDQKQDQNSDYTTNLESSVIFAKNGTEYVISVDNKNEFETFIYKVDDPEYFLYQYFFISDEDTSNSFISGSMWARDYEEAYNNLLNKGKYSQEDAQAHALSYLMDKYNMGLKIAKRENDLSEFKELKTEKDIKGKYSPQICQ
jgi:hypothetical protein